MPVVHLVRVAILLTGIALSSFAGVVLTGSHTFSGTTVSTVTWLDSDKLRVETKGEDVDQAVIYREDSGTFYILQPAEKTYSKMTKKDAEALLTRMDDAMRMMQQQMKNMPPEQAAMMEQMMKQQMAAAESSPTGKPVTWKKQAGKQKVGSWQCDRYEGRRGTARVSECWTVAPKKLGISTADMAVLSSMNAFMSRFSEKMGTAWYAGGVNGEKGAPAGIPVKTVVYEGDTKQHESILTKVEKTSLDDAMFMPPAGYAEISFDSGRKQ